MKPVKASVDSGDSPDGNRFSSLWRAMCEDEMGTYAALYQIDRLVFPVADQVHREIMRTIVLPGITPQ